MPAQQLTPGWSALVCFSFLSFAEVCDLGRCQDAFWDKMCAALVSVLSPVLCGKGLGVNVQNWEQLQDAANCLANFVQMQVSEAIDI